MLRGVPHKRRGRKAPPFSAAQKRSDDENDTFGDSAPPITGSRALRPLPGTHKRQQPRSLREEVSRTPFGGPSDTAAVPQRQQTHAAERNLRHLGHLWRRGRKV